MHVSQCTITFGRCSINGSYPVIAKHKFPTTFLCCSPNITVPSHLLSPSLSTSCSSPGAEAHATTHQPTQGSTHLPRLCTLTCAWNACSSLLHSSTSFETQPLQKSFLRATSFSQSRALLPSCLVFAFIISFVNCEGFPGDSVEESSCQWRRCEFEH